MIRIITNLKTNAINAPSCSINHFEFNEDPAVEETSMTSVTMQEAQAKLPDLIHQLLPGEEVVITENNQPVAKIVSELPKPVGGLRPPPGLGKGWITIVSDDDEHLRDFAEYMP